jgi:diguanylate cyclase (GGDEF)-like protein
VAQPIVHVLVIAPDADAGRAIHATLGGALPFQSHIARDFDEARTLLGLRTFDAAIIGGQSAGDTEAFTAGLGEAYPDMAVIPLESLERSDLSDQERLAQAILAACQKARSSRRHETMVRWLERESHVDALTGLHNRRAFDDRLRDLCEAMARAGSPITLILMDVVGTAAVNDAYGRDTGDGMIRRAASGVLRSVRGADFAARVDGDDFGVIVPNADLELGRRIARRITHEIERMNTGEWQDEIPVEVTFGVASGAGCASSELYAAAHMELVRSRRGPSMVTRFPLPDDTDGPSVA